jgi:hypothetical protein
MFRKFGCAIDRAVIYHQHFTHLTKSAMVADSFSTGMTTVTLRGGRRRRREFDDDEDGERECCFRAMAHRLKRAKTLTR